MTKDFIEVTGKHTFRIFFPLKHSLSRKKANSVKREKSFREITSIAKHRIISNVKFSKWK